VVRVVRGSKRNSLARRLYHSCFLNSISLAGIKTARTAGFSGHLGAGKGPADATCEAKEGVGSHFAKAKGQNQKDI
jgi:hypothetical protein